MIIMVHSHFIHSMIPQLKTVTGQCNEMRKKEKTKWPQLYNSPLILGKGGNTQSMSVSQLLL